MGHPAYDCGEMNVSGSKSRRAQANPSKIGYLDYFSGGVPPLSYFQMHVEEIVKTSSKSKAKTGELDFLSEICLIGLASYFEAFCKDQFSAIINIVPQTTLPFTATRDCKIPVKSLLHVISNLSHKLGFVIAEEYDFGSAKAINGLFYDLLKITPFSKADMARYAEFLNDRNLLVHHGGVFTLRYASQKFEPRTIKTHANWQSLVIGQSDVRKWSKFILRLAGKTADFSSKRLVDYANTNGIKLNKVKLAAVDALRWR
jgi:hypothetical protein